MKAGLFFAMSIVKIRLHKVILNFHRRMARDVSSFEREFRLHFIIEGCITLGTLSQVPGVGITVYAKGI